jgi:hypothetical protein
LREDVASHERVESLGEEQIAGRDLHILKEEGLRTSIENGQVYVVSVRVHRHLAGAWCDNGNAAGALQSVRAFDRAELGEITRSMMGAPCDSSKVKWGI